MVERDPTFLWETEALRRSSRGEGTGADPSDRSPARSELPPRHEPPPPEEPSGGDVPPGTMLVPITAWEKMLGQLGNLHEAGQQLAEARERAAKAETEARFLRERLAELRDELERAQTPAEEPSDSDDAGRPPDAAPTPVTAAARGLAESAARSLRRGLGRLLR